MKGGKAEVLSLGADDEAVFAVLASRLADPRSGSRTTLPEGWAEAFGRDSIGVG